jgi:hypothetical protein
MLGRKKGTSIPSSLAGVADSARTSRVASAPDFHVISGAYPMPATESLPYDE